uniref:Uncharacterized protein n=1 Tax=Arundo donax TaxID=35708 RepID=A0A0A9BVR3_ARUDO
MVSGREASTIPSMEQELWSARTLHRCTAMSKCEFHENHVKKLLCLSSNVD